MVSIELKSLNSKQLDIYTRLPNLYREKDLELRNHITNKLKRGKVELNITVEYLEEEKASLINPNIVRNYYSQLQSVSKDLDIYSKETLLQIIMRLPDVLKTETEELDSKEWASVVDSFNISINELDNFREQEGKALGNDLFYRLELIEKYLEQINKFESQRIENIKKRLTGYLNEWVGKENVDSTRFEQELVYYLEKLDITEEKIRLENHCKYFRSVMNEKEDEPVGKKLGFISQEMGREINTLGSKASDFDIQKLIVMMKDELEKIKEQLNNIL
ncbi:MAG: YicC family protein [Bacteroidales bacterium]|nr:MAG: YicC family protein [Bacteroidales bacterium]